MPYNSESIKLTGFLAGADISDFQYCPVELATTAGEVTRVTGSATGTTAPMLGVLQNDPTDGQAASIVILGVSKVIAGAAITQANLEAGGWISATSTGRVIHTTLDNTCIIGYALETATAGSDVITAFIMPQRL